MSLKRDFDKGEFKNENGEWPIVSIKVRKKKEKKSKTKDTAGENTVETSLSEFFKSLLKGTCP